jgi:hypothetical protein
MNQLLSRLQNEPWSLLVSLPRNDVKLAQAAIGAGAHGLKIHLNVHHHASGTRFGSWDEEREEVARIIQVAREAGASVGIVPGGSPFATPEEFRLMAQDGVDYFDAYPTDAPAWTLSQKHLDVMLAAYHGGSVAEMQALEQVGMAMCEASIVEQSLYGTPLNALDVARYRELAQGLSAPIIVPSQKAVATDDVAALKASGVKGLLIGAIVTGRDSESIASAVKSFLAC